MINLEIPKKFKPLASQANQVATEVFRPISRKYDEAEHSYPKELDMLASLIDGMNEGSDIGGAGAAGVRREKNDDGENRNGSNLSTVLGIIELCWGDVGLLLSMPRQGLGNSAIASVATEEQLEAVRRQVGGDGDHRAGSRLGLGRDPHHRRGRRRRVRPQRREDLRHLGRPRRPDRGLGHARPLEGTGGDQVVHRRARQPRPEAGPARAQARDPRLRHRQLHPAGLPGAERGAARRPRGEGEGLRRGDGNVRQHAAAGRGDGGRRRPGGAGGDPQAAEEGRASRSTTPPPPSPSPPPRRASSRWRPTTRPPGC